MTKAERRPARVAAYLARLDAARTPEAIEGRGALRQLWQNIRTAIAFGDRVRDVDYGPRGQGQRTRRLKNRERNVRRAQRRVLAEIRAARKAARS